MMLGLNRGEICLKYEEKNPKNNAYQKRLTNQGWKLGVGYATQIHWFEFSLCCHTKLWQPKKLWGKGNDTERDLKHKQKMIT